MLVTRALHAPAQRKASKTDYALALNATTFAVSSFGRIVQYRSASVGKTNSLYVEYSICGLVCPNSAATRGRIVNCRESIRSKRMAETVVRPACEFRSLTDTSKLAPCAHRNDGACHSAIWLQPCREIRL